MRNRFVDYLIKAADEGRADRLVVLTGDLGFSVLEPLQQRLGARFLNVGIAESLMASMAAGIAKQGYKVFIYSITPFATFRCLEQIRNDICYHNCDVTVVGVGAGYGYGPLGPTHHSFEDLSAMWALPNMKVYNPADLFQSDWAFEDVWTNNGPAYLRIGKGGEGILAEPLSSQIDGIFEYSDGADISVICTGHILKEVLELKQKVSQAGRKLQILSCAKLKPFSSRTLSERLRSDRIVVVEELSPYGGFSSHVAKVLLEAGLKIKSFETASVKDSFAKVVGSLDFQRRANNLDAESLMSNLKSFHQQS